MIEDIAVKALRCVQPRVTHAVLIDPVVEFAEPWKDRRDRNECPATIPHVTIFWPDCP